MGKIKFFICAILFSAVCKKTDGGIYDHNPFLNKVVVSAPATVQPASPDALNLPKPQVHPAVVHPAVVHPAVVHPQNHHQQPDHVGNSLVNQAHHQPSPGHIYAPSIPHQNHPNFPNIQFNLPQFPSTFPQIISFQPVVAPQQPAITTHQPPVVHTQPPVVVQPQPELNQVVGLRRMCLRTRGQFSSGRCNTFVNCWDDIAVEQTCPPGLAFNPAGYCDYLQNVDCQGRQFIELPLPQPEVPVLQPQPVVVPQPQPNPLPQTSVSYPSPSHPPYFPPNPPVVPQPQPNPHPSVPVFPPLPLPPFFQPNPAVVPQPQPNPQTSVPVPPAPPLPPVQPVVVPQPQPVPVPVPVNPSQGTPILPAQPQNPPGDVAYIPAGNFQDPKLKIKCLRVRGQFPSDVCHRYIDCWDDLVAEKECPPGLYFSEKGYCDYHYNVNCHNRTVIKTAQEGPLCPAAEGTFREKTNCSRYYTCISSAIVARYECPSGLSFNDVIGVCDYAYRVDCSREPFNYQPVKKVDMLQKVPAALMDSTIECRPGRVYRLNSACTSAALCRSGMTEVIHCPTGLSYDAPSDRCLPLQIARCQDN